jgi:hypothetical protein
VTLSMTAARAHNFVWCFQSNHPLPHACFMVNASNAVARRVHWVYLFRIISPEAVRREWMSEGPLSNLGKQGFCVCAPREELWLLMRQSFCCAVPAPLRLLSTGKD